MTPDAAFLIGAFIGVVCAEIAQYFRPRPTPKDKESKGA